MSATSIEWTDKTWNPTRGCSLVSPGCTNCYAMKQAHRFSGSGQPYEGLTELGNHGPRWSGAARFVPEMLGAPLQWRKPQRVFVNSMSDLFHDDITDEQIAQVWWVMGQCVGLLDPTRYRGHTFQILTKRPKRMHQWLSGWRDMDTRRRWVESFGERFDWASGPRYWPDVLPNVWLGVSCEDQQRANERIPLLLDTPAAVRFISAEPLLGPINLRAIWQDAVYRLDALTGDVYEGKRVDRGCVDHLDWVIVGGESGSGARKCLREWIMNVMLDCENADVPCFVKQLGPQIGLKHRKGGDPSEWDTRLRVRQFPGGAP